MTLQAHHLDACVSPRKAKKTGFQPTTPATRQVITPSRRGSLHFYSARIYAIIFSGLLVITPAAARAECRQAADPDEVTCRKEDQRLWIIARKNAEAATAVEQARTDRLTRELAACRSTQGACAALPPAAPYPWRDVAAVLTGGVAVGIILGVLLSK